MSVEQVIQLRVARAIDGGRGRWFRLHCTRLSGETGRQDFRNPVAGQSIDKWFRAASALEAVRIGTAEMDKWCGDRTAGRMRRTLCEEAVIEYYGERPARGVQVVPMFVATLRCGRLPSEPRRPVRGPAIDPLLGRG